MSLYLEIRACNTWFTLPSPFCKLYHSITHPPSTLFLSANIFVLVHSQEVLCYTLYIVKAKENSRQLVWQVIMVDGE
jgi:hypothetical protein